MERNRHRDVAAIQCRMSVRGEQLREPTRQGSTAIVLQGVNDRTE
jgi:hypothetical protein